MALDPCDFCCPANWRDDESARMSLGRVLCQIFTLLETGGGVADNVNIAAYGGVATSLGQKLMAASIPVTIASDQSPLAANLTLVGGGAITLGQKLMAASIPVTIASDQTAAANSVVSVITTSAAASTTAGIRAVSIANVGTASGTVDGAAFEAGATLSIAAIFDPVTQTFLKVPAIAYSAVGTTFRIVEIA